MKPKLLLLFSVMLSYHGFSQSISPAVVNSSGNTFTEGYYSFDWSVGELALVNTISSDDHSYMITNGFLQISTYDKKSNTKIFTRDELTILPNPTNGPVEINFQTRQQGTITITLYDAAGRKLMSRTAISFGQNTTEKIDLTAFAQGTYLVQISLNPAPGSVSKSGAYKIVKI